MATPILPLLLLGGDDKIAKDPLEYRGQDPDLLLDPKDVAKEHSDLYNDVLERVIKEDHAGGGNSSWEEVQKEAAKRTQYHVLEGTTAGKSAGEYLSIVGSERKGTTTVRAALDQTLARQSLTPGVGAEPTYESRIRGENNKRGYLHHLVMAGVDEERLSMARTLLEQERAEAHSEMGILGDLLQDPYENVLTGDVGVYENNTMRAFRLINTIEAFGSEAIQGVGMGLGQALHAVGEGLHLIDPEHDPLTKEDIGGRKSVDDTWYANFMVRSLDRSATLNGFPEIFQEVVVASDLNAHWDEEAQEYVNPGHVPGSQLLKPGEAGFVADMFWTAGMAFSLTGVAEKIAIGGPQHAVRLNRGFRTASQVEKDFKAAGVTIDPELKRHIINVTSDPSKGVLDLAETYANEWLRLYQAGVDPNVLFKNMPKDLQRGMDELAMDLGISNGVVTKNFDEYMRWYNREYNAPNFVPDLGSTAKKAQPASPSSAAFAEEASSTARATKATETTQDIIEGAPPKAEAQGAKPKPTPKPAEPDVSRVKKIEEVLKKVTETADAKIAEIKVIEEKLAKLTKSNAKLEKNHRALIKSHKKKIQNLTKKLEKETDAAEKARVADELQDTQRHLLLSESKIKAMEAGTEPAFRGYQQLLKKQLAEAEEELFSHQQAWKGQSTLLKKAEAEAKSFSRYWLESRAKLDELRKKYNSLEKGSTEKVLALEQLVEGLRRMWQAELAHATRVAGELEASSELSGIWLGRAKEAEKKLQDMQKRWIKGKARTDKDMQWLKNTLKAQEDESLDLLKRAEDAEAAKGAQGVEPAFTHYKNRADKLADEVAELESEIADAPWEDTSGYLADLELQGQKLLEAQGTIKAIEDTLDKIASGAKEGTPVERVEAFVAKQAKLKKDLDKAKKDLKKAEKEGSPEGVQDKIDNLQNELESAIANEAKARAAAKLEINTDVVNAEAISKGEYDEVEVLWRDSDGLWDSQRITLDPKWSFGHSMGRVYSEINGLKMMPEATASGEPWILKWTGANEKTVATAFDIGPQNPITAKEYFGEIKGGGPGFSKAYTQRRVIAHETPLRDSGGIHYNESGAPVYVQYWPDQIFNPKKASLKELKEQFKKLGIEEPFTENAKKSHYVETLEQWIATHPKEWNKANPIARTKWEDPLTYASGNSAKSDVHTRNLVQATRIRKYFVYNEGKYLSVPMTLEEAAAHMMKRSLTEKGFKKWEKGKKLTAKDFLEDPKASYWRDQLVTANPAKHREMFDPAKTMKPTRVLAGWRRSLPGSKGGGKKHGAMYPVANQHLNPVESRMLFRERSGISWDGISKQWYPYENWTDAAGKLKTGRHVDEQGIKWGLLMDEAGELPTIPSALRASMKKVFDETEPKVDKGGTAVDTTTTMIAIDPFGVLPQKTLAKLTPALALDILSGAPFTQWLWRKRYFKTKQPMAKPQTAAEQAGLDLVEDAFSMYFNSMRPNQKVVDIGEGVYVPANIAKDLKARIASSFEDEFGVSWAKFAEVHAAGKVLEMDAQTARRVNHYFDQYNSKVRVAEIGGKWTLETGAWDKAQTDVARGIGGKWTSQEYAIRDTGVIESWALGLTKRDQLKQGPVTALTNLIWQFQKYTVPKNVRMKFRRMVASIESAEDDIRRVLREATREGKSPIQALSRLYSQTPQFVTGAQLIRVRKWRDLAKRRATLKEGELDDWMGEVQALRTDILKYIGDPTTAPNRNLMRSIIINDEDALVKAMNGWASERSEQIVNFVSSFGTHAYLSIPRLSKRGLTKSWGEWEAKVQKKLNNQETAERVYQELLHMNAADTMDHLVEFTKVTDGAIDSGTLLKSRSAQVADAITGVMIERLQRAKYVKGVLELAEDLPFTLSKKDAEAVYKYIYKYDSEFFNLPVDVQSNAIKATRGLGFDTLPERAWAVGPRGAIDKSKMQGLTAVKVDGHEIFLPEWAATELKSAMREGADILLSKKWTDKGAAGQKLAQVLHNSGWWNWVNRAGKTLMTHGFVPLIRLNYYVTNAFGMIEMAYGRQGLVNGVKQIGRAAASGVAGAPIRVASYMGITPKTAPVLPTLLGRVDDLVIGKRNAPIGRNYITKDGRIYDIDTLAQEILTRGVTDTFSNLVGKADAALELQKSIRKDMEKGVGIFKVAQPLKDLGWNTTFMFRSMNRSINDALRRIEMHFRGSAFLNALDDGLSIAEAADVARKSQFDFGDLTKFEKAVAKKYVVFYTFFRRQYAAYLRLGLEHPERLMAYHKLQARQADFWGVDREEQAGISRYNLSGAWLGNEEPNETTPWGMKRIVEGVIHTTGPGTFDIGPSILTSLFEMASLDPYAKRRALEHEIGGKMSPAFELTYDVFTAITGGGEKEPALGVPQWLEQVLPQYVKKRTATPLDNPDYIYYTKLGEPYVVEAHPVLKKWIVDRLGSSLRQVQTYKDLWMLAPFISDEMKEEDRKGQSNFSLLTLLMKPFSYATAEQLQAKSKRKATQQMRRIRQEIDSHLPDDEQKNLEEIE